MGTCLHIHRQECSEGSLWEDGREKEGSPGIFLGRRRVLLQPQQAFEDKHSSGFPKPLSSALVRGLWGTGGMHKHFAINQPQQTSSQAEQGTKISSHLLHCSGEKCGAQRFASPRSCTQINTSTTTLPRWISPAGLLCLVQSPLHESNPARQPHYHPPPAPLQEPASLTTAFVFWRAKNARGNRLPHH